VVRGRSALRQGGCCANECDLVELLERVEPCELRCAVSPISVAREQLLPRLAPTAPSWWQWGERLPFECLGLVARQDFKSDRFEWAGDEASDDVDIEVLPLRAPICSLLNVTCRFRGNFSLARLGFGTATCLILGCSLVCLIKLRERPCRLTSHATSVY